MRSFWRLAVVAATLTMAGESAFAAGAFKDPIDTPAITSNLAEKQVMLAVTRVGERLIAVGQSGYIVSSTDGGKSWQQVPCPVSADLVSVNFSSTNNGWITGHDGVVLKTEDGGSTWSKVLDGRTALKYLQDYYKPRADAGNADAIREMSNIEMSWNGQPQLPFLDVLFEDNRRGIIVGPYGMILQTTDGGSSWLPLLDHVDNPDHLHLNMLRKIGTDLYIPSERGTIFWRGAGRSGFSRISTGYTGTFFGIAGSSAGIVAYGLRGKAYFSGDGGKTWHKADTRTDISLVADVTLADGRLVLLALNGALIVSDDGGKTFVPMSSDIGVIAAGMTLASPNSLAVAGIIGMYSQPIR